jgi:N-acetylglucosamine-6-phosphate deacetylase
MFRDLIDLHTHGIGRYDTRTVNPEEILKLAAVHARAGTSAILPAIYSGTIERMRSHMEAVKIAIRRQDAGGTSQLRRNDSNAVYGGIRKSSRILGVHLEGPFLNPLQCGVQDRRSFVMPRLSVLKKLIGGYEDIIRIITIAPELPGALKLIERCVSLGIRVNMGHSDATFKQALRGKNAGATGISHIFNAMRHFHHREPGLAGFGLVDDDVYIEIIADGEHLDEHTLRLIERIKRSDRIILVSDTVKGAGMKRPVPVTGKGVIAGGSLPLSGAVNNLVEAGISQDRAWAFASRNPLDYLGSA